MFKTILFTIGCLISSVGYAQSFTYDMYYSTDNNGYDVMKNTIGYNYEYSDIEHYWGVNVQQIDFRNPKARNTNNAIFYDFADSNTNVKWNGNVGTDGHTIVGNGEFYAEDRNGLRDEVFFERELVLTKAGNDLNLYSTLVGVAKDVQLANRLSATGVVAEQYFDGGNYRTILKGRLSYLVSEDYGVSAQLRVRSYYDSQVNPYDYFSPRWYTEIVPVLSVRRFVNGNQLYVAVGSGKQKVAGQPWKKNNLFQAGWASPKYNQKWYLKINVGYTDALSDFSYSYKYIETLLVIPL